MRRTLRAIWLGAGIVFLLACVLRIALGYPLQGILGAVFGALCLIPPVFDRIKSWRHPWLSFCGLFLGCLLVCSPFPKKLSYGSLWKSLTSHNSTEVELSVTAVPTSVTQFVRETTPTIPEQPSAAPTSAAATATVTVAPVITKAPTATSTPAPTNTPTPLPEPVLQVICLDVGQGDATLLLHTDASGRQWSLVMDGGDRGTSSFVVSRLENVYHVSAPTVVCSHYDADHAFGLIGVIQKLHANSVYCPDYVADTATYRKFTSYLSGENVGAVVHPKPGDTIPFGDCDILVLGPVDENAELENNRSIVLLVTYQGKTFLLPGDAELDEESAILSGGFLPIKDVDVFHASHHGSYSGALPEFLNAVVGKDTITLISVGKDNEYEHPHNVTLRRLSEAGCENILRTDEHGEIVFTVKNGELSVTTER